MYREIEKADEDAVFKLGEEDFTWAYERLSWNRVVLRFFIECFPKLCFVYLEDGAVKGFCLSMAKDSLGYICWAAVQKDARRSGIAETLVGHSIGAMKAAGCTEIGSHVRADGRADAGLSKLGFEDLNEPKKEMRLYFR